LSLELDASIDLTAARSVRLAGRDFPIPPLLGNDRYGDCVFAGAAHETMMLAREAGNAVWFSDAGVPADYAAMTGFDLRNPQTDQGTGIQAAADYRRKTGIADACGKRHRCRGAAKPYRVADLPIRAAAWGRTRTATGKIAELGKLLAIGDIRDLRYELIYATDKAPEQLDEIKDLLQQKGSAPIVRTPRARDEDYPT
jgi:hypothetical protein